MQAGEPTLIRSMRDAALYPHPVTDLRVVETHISWILLTGPFAYKVKKPVDLGFLDFSTLEQRRFFCEEELRLNRRLAPELYVDLVTITGTFEAPCIDGAGSGIEYAVRMVQFASAAQFDRLLASGRLTTGLMERLAHVLAGFHAGAARADTGDEYGSPAAIRGPARENFAHLRLPAGFSAEERVLRELEQWSERVGTELEPLFRQRQAGGFVRECHGDLHLANITLHDGAPTPFDCLEFSAPLRWIDVMNEVAFLTMDLDEHGRSDLALRFLNEYLHHTGDYAGLRLLRYYQVYRALVRAKVECIRLAQSAPSSAGAYEPLLAYLALARRYTLAAPCALLIAHGLSGSGKTTLSRELLAPCGLIRIRSDVERKRLAGIPPGTPRPTAVGTGLYSRTVGERTYAHLGELATAIMAAGFPVLVDATFLKREQRETFRALAAQWRVPFVILEFQASEEELRERLRSRRPGTDASDADVAVLNQQLATHEPLERDERPDVIAIDSGHTPDFNGLSARILARITSCPASDDTA